MRHLIIILMIALLPLRIWAVDMMAVSMAGQQLHAVRAMQMTPSGMGEQSLPTQPVVQARAPFSTDCPMMLMLAGKQVADTDGKTGSTDFKACMTCQLCMGLVTAYAPRGPLLMPLPSAALGLGSATFTSAERVPGFKPPIS